MQQCVERDIEPEGFEPWTFSDQRLDQEALAAADVEHPHAGLKPILCDDVARHRVPATVIAIAAIAVLARAVPIHLAILLGDGDDGGGLGLGPLLDIAVCLRKSAQESEVRHQPNSWCCARARPSSMGV